MEEKMSNHHFVRQWKKQCSDIIRTAYPSLEKDEVSNVLDGIISTRLKNGEVILDNNYLKRQKRSTMLDLIDTIEEKKPIVAGNGVLFKQHKDSINPSIQMIKDFLASRKRYKKKMFECEEGSYEYNKLDRMQLNEKININAFYGASGNEGFIFFNRNCTTSTTATGQSLISTTSTAIEEFMSNNIKFVSIDECLVFINRIVKEKHKLDSSFLPFIPIERLLNRLKDKFFEYDDDYTQILFDYLMGLSQDDINRIYFKNNLYEFSMIPNIRMMLLEFFKNIDKMRSTSLKDEFGEDEDSKERIKTLSKYYLEFVHNNYPVYDRIHRLKNDTRKEVVVVDTDSYLWESHMATCV